MKRVELLAPAGDLDKLKIAIDYGADAVYIGGEVYGLRAGAKNFSSEAIREGVEYAHSKDKKVYLTLNIIPHNDDIDELDAYLESIKNLGLDAVIVSDPGILMKVKENMPSVEIHLSTQANTTNYAAANFWYDMGVKRIVLARELTYEEIKTFREKTIADLELESFVHGAMCISYSGRCLLSNYMAGRDANQGACAHPCRWEYHLMEEKRPGEYFKVVEDEKGTYFFNSKDLCLIEHVPDLIKAGIRSLKLEGRMKSIFYVATVVSNYRKVIDQYYEQGENYKFDQRYLKELQKMSHREFTKGFYFGKPDNEEQLYDTTAYLRNYDFLGLVKSYDEETGYATIEQRNKIVLGDEVEIIGPGIDYFNHKVEIMLDENDQPIETAPHAQQILKIKMNRKVAPNYMLRKEIR